MDGPSVQLHQDLRGAISKALSSRRPLLTHLSADTAWLLSIPRPQQATRRGGRLYYNLIIDPWLSGTQVDVTRWLSKQWHVVEPRLPNIAAVEEMLREMELLASGLRFGKGRTVAAEEMDEQDGVETFIDAVAISHEFTDHCHQQTLMDISANVPVFATEKAAALIRSWSHFRHVQVIPHFSHNPDWHATSVPPLPEWLGISRLVTRSDMLYFHSAILITFNNGELGRRGNAASADVDDDAAEAVIYTPHGIHSDSEDLDFLRNSASPSIQTLAFLHGLEDIVLGSAHAQLNLGAHNGLRAQRLLKARYWIGTHDEDKQGSGIVGWLLRRKKLSVKDAVAEEQRRRKDRKQDSITAEEEDVLGSFEGVNWRDVGNGESVLLL